MEGLLAFLTLRVFLEGDLTFLDFLAGVFAFFFFLAAPPCWTGVAAIEPAVKAPG